MTEPTATIDAVATPNQATQVDGTFLPSRIAAAFARCRAEGRAAFIPYLTGGYPTLAMSEELLPALVAGGADLVEIGIPFSDPLADGATVQHASQVALDHGTTLADCLAIARRARERGIDLPIAFMGYANPFYQYGLERLARDAAAAGVDGFIVPDLPVEESDEFLEPLRAHGRDLIFLVAPTSTDARLRAVAERASGFVYCVSLTGVTGARDHLSEELPAYLARVRGHTDLPLVVGFGISRPEHVRAVATLADGVVVASALINHLDRLPAEEQVAGATAFVRELAAAARR
jgi:tryptophan synthase alpha chain